MSEVQPAPDLDPNPKGYNFRLYYPYTKVRDPFARGAAGACAIVRSQTNVLERLRWLRQQMDRDDRAIKIHRQSMLPDN